MILELENIMHGGMSQREVAEFLGVSRNAVWEVEQRAMKKIQRAFEKDAAAHGMTVDEYLFNN